jgi:hypothetical protein
LSDEAILLFRDVSTLQVGTKIINPSQSAAFPAPKQTCSFGQCTPATFTMYTDVLNESVILTLRPGTSLQSGSLFTTAARRKRRRRRRSRSLFWGHAQFLHTPLSCPSVFLPACLPAFLSPSSSSCM